MKRKILLYLNIIYIIAPIGPYKDYQHYAAVTGSNHSEPCNTRGISDHDKTRPLYRSSKFLLKSNANVCESQLNWQQHLLMSNQINKLYRSKNIIFIRLLMYNDQNENTNSFRIM